MARFSILLLLVTIAYVQTSEGRSFGEFFRQVWEEASVPPSLSTPSPSPTPTPSPPPSPSPSPSPIANYDKLTLVYTWGPSYCKKGKGCIIPNTAKKIWTIHGLWPFRSNVSSIIKKNSFNSNVSPPPINCQGPSYNDSAISSIQTTLDEKWPNYQTGGTNDAFWKREYEKHGTCASDLPTFDSQLKYFEGTLDLYDTYDIETFLANGTTAVTPSNTHTYTLDNITSALKKGLNGVEPNVYCFWRKRQKTQYLWEVRLCFDKNLQPITCGSELVGGGQCEFGRTVVYPPFPSYIPVISQPGVSDDLAYPFLLDVAEMGAREMMMKEEE